MSSTPNFDAFREAASVTPPNIEAARLALQGVGAEMVTSQDRGQYAKEVAELAGRIATETNDQTVMNEFSVHANSYKAMAQVFGEKTAPQPTQTSGKKQTGGKSDKPAS